MRAISIPRWRWPRGRASRDLPYDMAEGTLIVALSIAAVALVWVLLRPLGPVGNWQAKGAVLAPADPAILTRFDPFLRSAPAGPAAVTSLPLKLFGVRVDTAMGRGSAILAGPDEIQMSIAVGEEIQPGVVLKSVAFDSVTISRGGVDEQLFLDQSATAQPGAPSPAGSPSPSVTPGAAQIMSAINFAPRLANGAVTGFTLSPGGTGTAFAATGLRAGDVVTQINGSSIGSLEEATAALARSGANGANFTIERDGRTLSLLVRTPQ